MTTTTAPAPAPTATPMGQCPTGAHCTQPACRIDGCKAAKQARALAHYLPMAAEAVAPRRFSTVYCSQCGAEFHGSPRDGGFSSCREHIAPASHAALFARLRGAL